MLFYLSSLRRTKLLGGQSFECVAVERLLDVLVGDLDIAEAIRDCLPQLAVDAGL